MWSCSPEFGFPDVSKERGDFVVKDSGVQEQIHLEVVRAYVDSLSHVEMANSRELIQFLLLVHSGVIYLFLSEMCKL
jgi:hypothetical protein